MLLDKYADEAYSLFQNKLRNEDRAEVWLHRGLERMTYEEGHTLDPSEADVFIICGYLHLNRELNKTSTEQVVELYSKSIVNKTKPHIVAIPMSSYTTLHNPTRIGLKQLMKALRKNEVNLWFVGFERNPMRQGGIEPARIIPVPHM